MSEQRVVWKSVLLGLGAGLIHCLTALVLVVVLVACVPRHIQLFDEFDADLPHLTVLVISISELAVNYWYLIIVPLMFDCALLVGLSLAPPAYSWLGRAWSTLVLFFTIVFLGFVFLSVSLPLERITPNSAPPSPTQPSEADEPPIDQPVLEDSNP